MFSPQKILESIGLNNKEINIYLTLLKYGDQPAGVLSKKSGINRSTTYSITEELKNKGLISTYKKRDIQYFHADSVKDLFNYLATEKKEAERKINTLKENFNILEEIQNKSNFKPNVEFYEGLEGVKKVYDKTLSANNTIYAFFGRDFYTESLKNYITSEYLPKRLEKNLQVKALMQSNLYEENDPIQLRERRYYKTDESLQVEINVFNQSVAFISFTDDIYIGVIIEDPKISTALKTLHNLIWKLTS